VTDDTKAETGPRHTVGNLLRETRQSYGGEIDRIAATLRIRPAYLTAIEESQYDKLPGPVYAQGFVRAYAVHLGLDGNEAIRRFKQEIEGLEVSRDLSFPVPLAERSIPGGTMLLAALILAICGYGLWYYVSTGDRAHPERVSAVPPDLVAATLPPPAPPPPPPSQTPPVAPATNATTAAATVAAAPPAGPSPPPAIAPLAPAPVSALNAIAPPPSANPVPVNVTSAPSAPPPASAPAAPQIAAAPAAAPAPPAAPVAASATNSPAPPRVFGAPADVPARIVVHAIRDSWIQLRDGDQILIERTLHPGDTVRVPEESGLSLRTGNGAGIALEVDGKLGKPLSGTVRTVALDADRLTGGAVPRSE
jgi:cytoskeleton protein RodZ